MASANVRPSARGVCFWYQSVGIAKALASQRYRIGHFIELTSGADVIASEQLPSWVARSAHTIVCVRPCVTSVLDRQLKALRATGVRLIADYDDLLFAGHVSGLPASAQGNGHARDQSARLAGYARAIDTFDQFTVSTRALAARLTALRPNAKVSVVPNGLSAAWVQQGRTIYRSFSSADELVLRYFAGSPSHDQDLAAIAPALAAFLSEQPAIRLEIFGPVKLSAGTLPTRQVQWRRKVDYECLPQFLATAWASIAPLSPTEFSICKSAIKFLESGAFCCPTLASTNDDLQRHRDLGAPINFCATTDDWYRSLRRLLDPSERKTLGEKALAHVDAHGMAESHRTRWLDVLTGDHP